MRMLNLMSKENREICWINSKLKQPTRLFKVNQKYLMTNLDMMMMALMMKEKTMVVMKLMTNEKFHLDHNHRMIKQESS